MASFVPYKVIQVVESTTSLVTNKLLVHLNPTTWLIDPVVKTVFADALAATILKPAKVASTHGGAGSFAFGHTMMAIQERNSAIEFLQTGIMRQVR